MLVLIKNLVALLLIFYDVLAEKNYITENPLWFLPRYWTQDLITLFLEVAPGSEKNCLTSNNGSLNITLWLIENNTLTHFDNIAKLDPHVPTVYVIHGWSAHKDNVEPIWKAYQNKPPKNVLVVDWQRYSKMLYPDSVCYVELLGEYLAKRICDMAKYPGINPEDIHLVGHSLGAQMSGIIGYHTQRKGCGTIGRITALSPAGPYYQSRPKPHRVDDSDARFVDAINTDEGQFGYVGSVGHVDFYPNCGSFQPACSFDLLKSFNILKNVISFSGCHHGFSILLYAESILRNGFKATSCPGCGIGICFPNFLKPDSVYMGEYVTRHPKQKNYFVLTGIKSPYGLGPVIPTDNNQTVNTTR